MGRGMGNSPRDEINSLLRGGGKLVFVVAAVVLAVAFAVFGLLG